MFLITLGVVAVAWAATFFLKEIKLGSRMEADDSRRLSIPETGAADND